MTSLERDNTEADAWVAQEKERFSRSGAFAEIKGAVIWTDHGGENGQALVPVDPDALVEEINTEGMPMLRDHDPGAPAGRLLAARTFTRADGKKYVAALAGFYGDATRISFRALGLDAMAPAASPQRLDPLRPDCCLIAAADPREIATEWLDAALSDAPLPIIRKELSHNAAEPLQELIRIGLPYILLVWNPFVTTIASEAGKKAYAEVHEWLRKFLERLGERRNPILDVQSHVHGCHVSFLFRGKHVKQNYAAHEALAVASAQAAQLVVNMKARGVTPHTLTYEFDPEAGRWFPSYAVLREGPIVTDRNILIAIEQLPSSLSLGIGRTESIRSG